MKPILRFTVFLAVLFLVMSGLVFSMQNSFIYFPEQAPEAALEKLAAENGLMPWRNKLGDLIGWQTKDGNPSLPMVIFHGNAGHALHRIFLVQRLREAGFTGRIHIMEYPGYGSRQGTPSETALVEAGVAALGDFPDKVLLLGESLGTGVASAVAGKLPEKVRSVILITPFDSLLETAKIHYPFLPVGMLLRDRYESVKNIVPFPGPVAFLLAGQDDLVPAKLGKRFFDSYEGTKKLWVVEEAGHNGIAWGLSIPEWKQVLDFTNANDSRTP